MFPFVRFLWMPLVVAACGDLDVKSIRTGDSVPQALQGEWGGLWQSNQDLDGGSLTLRIQDFGGEPLVSVVISNPCVQPRDYQFRVTGARIELLADGQPVFSALLGSDRTLVGTYACAADAGAWDATWQRDLPLVLDLSGTWNGALSVPGAPEQVLVLHLLQVVRSGGLVLDGTLELPGVLPAPLPLRGWVTFREGAFDLALTNLEGELLQFQMIGAGDVDDLRVDNGLLHVSAPGQVPFHQGVWRVQWAGP